jgi:hypothetical protein
MSANMNDVFDRYRQRPDKSKELDAITTAEENVFSAAYVIWMRALETLPDGCLSPFQLTKRQQIKPKEPRSPGAGRRNDWADVS